MKTNTFLAMLHGFVKHFTTLVIAELMGMGSKLLELNLNTLKIMGINAVVACLPIAYNYLNPNYKQYGGSKEPLKPIKRK